MWNSLYMQFAVAFSNSNVLLSAMHAEHGLSYARRRHYWRHLYLGRCILGADRALQCDALLMGLQAVTRCRRIL